MGDPFPCCVPGPGWGRGRAGGVLPGRSAGNEDSSDGTWLRLRVADLPEAVLADDLAVRPERPQVAAAYLDALSLHSRAADGPLGRTAGPAGEVIVIAVVHIGNAPEARGQPAAHLVPTRKAAPPPVGPAGRLEHAILGEMRHDRVEVMPVETVEHLLERLDVAFAGHEASTPPAQPWEPHCISRPHAGSTPIVRGQPGTFQPSSSAP